ncbi:MAG TPA: hypothetical protein VGN19_11135 [Pedococcus sp.]|nr:hypothetical protein [Pedococcus sp.]
MLRPRLVRRIVLAATGPRGGHQIHDRTGDINRMANNADNGIKDLLQNSFEVTETSRPFGRQYVQKAFARTEGGPAQRPGGHARPARRDRCLGRP